MINIWGKISNDTQSTQYIYVMFMFPQGIKGVKQSFNLFWGFCTKIICVHNLPISLPKYIYEVGHFHMPSVGTTLQNNTWSGFMLRTNGRRGGSLIRLKAT